MPPQRNRLHIGMASAAVFVGAFATVVMGAGPAAASQKKCPNGTNLVTVFGSVVCHVVDGLTGGGHNAKPPKGGSHGSNATPGKGDSKPKPKAKPPKSHSTGASKGAALAPLSVPTGFAPAFDSPQKQIAIPQLPEIVPEPNVLPPQADTRLVAPASAIEQDTSAVAVAAAAGSAGAVGALHLSVVGWRLRRRIPAD